MLQQAKNRLIIAGGFVLSLWVVFGISFLLPSLNDWGVVPRSTGGIPGIFSMHFLHGSFGHLLSNTIPLSILMVLLIFSRDDAFRLSIVIAIASAGLLWIVGRNAVHIGASVLVFGLIAFLIASGFVEKRFFDVLLTILVLFFFGGSLLWGVLPSFGSRVSWEGHLCGAIAGAVVAFLNKRSLDSNVTDPLEQSIQTFPHSGSVQ